MVIQQSGDPYVMNAFRSVATHAKALMIPEFGILNISITDFNVFASNGTLPGITLSHYQGKEKELWDELWSLTILFVMQSTRIRKI